MVRTTDKNFAPYAGPTAVISVIRRFRDTGLNWPLTKDEIQRVGITTSLATRTLSALQFLNLIDKDGNRTETINTLGRASTDEYPEVLANIIQDAYADIFTTINLATANETQYFDAFRTKTPEKQRQRMVSLFRALCIEAGIVEGDSPNVNQQKQKAQKSPPIRTKKQAPVQQEQKFRVPFERNGSEYWYRKLEPLFTKLPNPSSPSWTAEDREKWHQALTAVLDLYIPVKENKGGDNYAPSASQEQHP